MTFDSQKIAKFWPFYLFFAYNSKTTHQQPTEELVYIKMNAHKIMCQVSSLKVKTNDNILTCNGPCPLAKCLKVYVNEHWQWNYEFDELCIFCMFSYKREGNGMLKNVTITEK